MNGRFQHAMEGIAHAAGSWPHFALWLLLLVGWVALGPMLGWSNTWQLIANTPTTWYELFLGLALLVDGALQVRMMLEAEARDREIIEHVLRLEERILEDVEGHRG